MRAPRFLIAAGVFVLPWLFCTAALAEPARLCMIPLPPSPPSQYYNPDHPPILMQARTFPGSRWPIFRAWGASGLIFVLNENDQLEVSRGLPMDLAGHYVAEPSGRVVGYWPQSGTQLYIQDPTNGRFVGLNGTDVKTIGIVSNAAWISGRHATLVATSRGLFSLTGGSAPRVQPLVLAGSAPGKVDWINDLPLHHAAALGTDGGGAFVLNSDNSIREVPGFQIPHNSGTQFSEIGDPDRLLIETGEELWTAPLRREGDTTIPDRARKLTSYVFEGNHLQYYPAIRQYLVYARTNSWLSHSSRLLQLQDKLNPVADSAGLDHPHIRDLASRGIVTIETFKSGIFTYDGRGALRPVPHSTAADIGAYPKVYELTSQDKVVVLTISGLYELTTANRLDRLPLPSDLEGAKFDQLAELPASHAAVIFADRGAFALDATGKLSRIPGGRGVDSGAGGVDLATRIPVRESLFVSTYRRGAFMIFDQDILKQKTGGQGPCAAAR